MKEISTELLGLKNDFEQWRMTRNSRREKIPDELWKLAASAARLHGSSLVAKVLALDFYQLRARLNEKSSASIAVSNVTRLELGSNSDDYIEFVKPSGGKMRILAQSPIATQIVFKFLEGF